MRAQREGPVGAQRQEDYHENHCLIFALATMEGCSSRWAAIVPGDGPRQHTRSLQRRQVQYPRETFQVAAGRCGSRVTAGP